MQIEMFQSQIPTTPGRKLVSTIAYMSIILMLFTYVGTIDLFFIIYSVKFRLLDSLDAKISSAEEGSQGASLIREQAMSQPREEASDEICNSLLGHLPENRSELHDAGDPHDPWDQMKWIGKPARCRVKGQLIESLDEHYNFRRGYALRFVNDVEDKTHLLPWLLGSRINLNLSPRRVYLDLGANAFTTSIQWFMRMYPCDFTEVHAFEIDTELLKRPEMEFKEADNWEDEASLNTRAIAVKNTPGVPKWMLDRMRFHNQLVSDGDDAATKAVNITRFMKETLNLTPSDTVIVKMDIESSEWPILESWLQDPEMAHIVDELFVEIHYEDPSMSAFMWDQFAPITRDEASVLLASLRLKGVFVHAWP